MLSLWRNMIKHVSAVPRHPHANFSPFIDTAEGLFRASPDSRKQQKATAEYACRFLGWAIVALLAITTAMSRGQSVTNTYNFTYTDRSALFADGWSYVATIPGGGTRDTENTNAANGGVVSYDQVAHQGSLQVPCDLGDLFGTLNNSRNSLFHNIGSNWTSLRLQFSFAPTTNYQQVNFALYQDDDNYLEIGMLYSSGNTVSLFREINQFTLTLNSSANIATNMFLRLDQDLNTANVTAFYSTNGTTWVNMGSLSQSFVNARVCVWTGGSSVQWTNGLPVVSVQRVDVITTNNYVAPPAGLIVQPQHLVFSAIAGQPCTNLQALHVVLNNNQYPPVSWTPPVNWTITNKSTWCATSITNGTTPSTCDVSVNTAGLLPGIYQASLNVGAPGTTSAVANVTLVVNPNSRARPATWQGAKSGAMTVWVDDSFPTAFDDLTTNGFAGTYVMWHLGAPAYFTTYYNAGMELGAHTVDHPCFPVNDASIQYELATNIASLLATTPVPQSQVISFAWPCGVNTPDEEAIAANYFLISRGYNINQLENPSPYDFMNLKSFNSHEHFPFPPADLKTEVDAAITNGQWFIMALHSTNNDNGAIVYAVGKDIWVAPAGTIAKYILQRDRTVVTNYVESTGKIQFSIYRLALDPSPVRSFETAIGPQDTLTMQVDISGISAITGLTTNGTACPYSTTVKNGRTLLLFNTVVTTASQSVVLSFAPNSPPVLPAQTNVSVNELTLLTITNSATDPDGSVEVLNYTLAAPAGAQIDTNGVITWTPAEGQGPSTNTFTTVVTDNGVPPLSATNSFNVTVNEVNFPPVLPNQANRTIGRYMSLLVTNTALDSDIPPNPLTYQLMSAPTNAVIDTNGIIRWTPSPAQIPSTNLFTTVVMDTNQWAVNAKSLSATNNFNVIVLVGPVLPVQTNQTINELTSLTVTNAATDTSASNVATNSLSFSYTNRTALLADGWSFIATLPNGTARNTENTNGPTAISYTNGIVRIPCGGGDLWQSLNNTTNTLFRTLPANWISLRLAVAFSPSANYQQAYLTLYQDDDNYLEAGFDFNGGSEALMVQEIAGAANVVSSAPVTATNLSFRLDRDPATGNVSGLYSLDGVTWNALATVTQNLNNPRLAIWTGGSTGPVINLDLQRLDIVQSNSVGAVLAYQLLNAPAGAIIDGNGVITWTPSEAQGPSTNVLTTIVSDYSSPPLTATNSFTVVVNEVNSAPVLPVQADITTIGGAALLVTNTASDPDIPVNSLTYQLIAAPAGASINTNGIISWTPSAAQTPSTNVFRTAVTDFNPWALNSQHLSATNRFVVYVQANTGAPILATNADATVNELTALRVTNAVFDPNNQTNSPGPVATSSIYFTYTNRADLLNDGWSFIEYSNGVPYNTEITNTNIGVIAYAQTNPAIGTVMRVPCDIGDMWGTPPTYLYNYTRNSIFRNLPTNWISMRLSFSFNPTLDFQQAHIGLYQDVDNYVEVGFAHNSQINPSAGDLAATMVWELAGAPDHFTSVIPQGSTNISLRMDRDPTTGNFSGFFSTDGLNWTNLGTVLPTFWAPNPNLPTPRLGVWVGSNPQPYTQNLLVCDLSRVDIVLSNQPVSYSIASQNITFTLPGGPAGATVGTNGVLTWTPSEAQGPSTNLITVVATENGAPPLSATNSFTVVVNEVNLPPVLPVQNNRTLIGASPLIVTNTATDPDIPANSLTYQFLVAPTNAAIDTNGIITWTPTQAQVPSTNVFTTIVTDFNPWAINNQHLSATNSFTVTVNGPQLPSQTNRTINEMTALVVTNTAAESGYTAQVTTNSYLFTYSNRTALTNDAWGFVATNPDGTSRNTENTTLSGPLISYDQGVHPGSLRIPCAPGDIWGSQNNTTNSLFRSLPTNWLSLRLSFTFAPTVNYQQILLAVYQDDDNYVEAGMDYNGRREAVMNQEVGGAPTTVNSIASSATNFFARLDRNPNNGNITGFYSTNGTNWTTLATVSQALVNPRLCVWVGGAQGAFSTNAPSADIKELDMIISNASVGVLTYSLLNPPAGASIDTNGIITWTPSEAQGPGTNVITTFVADNEVPPVFATNSFTVIVNEVNLPPVLPVQTNRTSIGYSTVVVTNTAFDPDIPTNTLTYSFLVAPTNALIDTNGVITWSPSLAQIPSTNVFTTLVTDYNPWAVNSQHLSATNSFTVTVLPVPVLTVTANSTNRAYGQLNPTFTGSLVGLQSGDNITANFVSSATTNSAVGNYQITPVLIDPGSKLTNYNIVTNLGVLSVTQAVMTIAVNNSSRAYGQTNPLFSSTLLGLQNGDVITVSNYITLATTNSVVGNYPVTPQLADPGLKLGNYSVLTNVGTLTVTQAVLAVSVSNTNRAYGQANPSFNSTVAGLQNGDNVTVTNYTTAATTNSAVGAFPVYPQLSDPALVLSNYNVVTNAGILTVIQAPLTVSVNNTNRGYGQANPSFTSTVAGLLNGDVITVSGYSTPATANSSVGTYPILPVLSDLAAVLGNYNVVTNAGALTVGQSVLTVSVDNTNRAYGQPNPVFTSTILGLQNGDNITVSNYVTAATTNSVVGNYTVTPQLADPALELSNYSVVTNLGTLAVTQALVTVSVNNTNRGYGQVNPAFSSTVIGLQNGDSVTVTNYITTATTNSIVGTYPVYPQLSDPLAVLGNYSVLTNVGTLNVTQAMLTVSVSSTNRGYGQANPGFSSTVAGLQNGDNITVTNYTTAAVTNSAAGVYPVYPQLSDPAAVLGNYSVVTNAGTLTVTQALLTVSVNSTNRQYGQVNPAFASTIAGLLNGDVITVSGYSTPATTNSAVGTYPILPILADPGVVLGNYSVATNPGTLTVAPASLVVTVYSTNRPYGQANPIFTGTISGTQNGDNITANYVSSATTNSSVGNYPIAPVLNDPGQKLADYAVTTNNGTLTITPAALIVLDSTALIAEGCLPTNNAVDPGETVTLLFALRNIGVAGTANLVATLVQSNGVSLPSGPQTYGALPAGGSAVSQPFTFTAAGSCGGAITATLQLQDGAVNLGTVSTTFTLGQVATNFVENFDEVGAPLLPKGWISTSSGAEVPWVTEDTVVASGINGVFVPDSADVGLSDLISPAFTVTLNQPQLTFQNFYSLEPGPGTNGYDGGVLEIKIGTNDFTDILQAGGTFVSGGYNSVIVGDYNNPLATRLAWSGDSGGFITTKVNLPSSVLGQSIQLRWRCGTDNSGPYPGWWIDSVSITGTTCCTNGAIPPAPEILSLNLANGAAVVAWRAAVGQTYRLQYKDNFNDPNWTDVLPDIVAQSTIVSATNALSGAPERFYRVMLK